jgi:hypothetical protein
MEQNVSCPCCQDALNPYDRRDRKCRDENGDWQVLAIRRLRCQNPRCRRIHAELPDFLVPYKRYQVGVIAAVLGGTARIAPLEESTRQRWRAWYDRLREHLLGVAASIRRQMQEAARTLLASPNTEIFPIPETDLPSLADLVRLAVNSGNWLTTRSAMVTGPLAL